MYENKQMIVRSNRLLLVFQALCLGVVLGALLSVLASMLGGFLPFWIYRWVRWPISLLMCSVIVLGISLLRTTTVTLDNNRITIRHLGKMGTWPLDCEITSETRTVVRVLQGFKLLQWKHYLHIFNKTGVDTCRLYAFRQKDVTRLVEAIRVQRTNKLPLEEKIAYIDETWEDEQQCQIPRRQILSSERRWLLGIGLLLVGLLLVPLELTQMSTQSGGTWWQLILLALAIGFTLLLLIAQTIHLQQNAVRCPHLIRLRGEHLMIDEMHISMSAIDSISLTSITCKSTSILPVQRYMTIQTQGRSMRYWLGSEKSCPNEVYGVLYDLLKQACIFHPERLRFVTKRSIWTH